MLDVVFAIMLSVFAKVEDLWPLLEVPWVRDWDGWKEATMVLSSITDDGTETTDCVEEYVSRFCQLVQNNKDVPLTTDSARRDQLLTQGKRIGVGLVHGNNDCCADSLLQCLAFQGLVQKKLCDKSTEAVQLRKKACVACRQHLIWHADVRLHPVQRTDVGTIADATDAEHHAAYLQHDTQGEAIVRFCNTSDRATVLNTEACASLSILDLILLSWTLWRRRCPSACKWPMQQEHRLAPLI